MALVLNGSANTIGGLAVGGLPDGIVDTDMLATGAATQAKRTYAAGEVVQVVTKSLTAWDSSSIAGNAWWDNPGGANLRVDITPTATSSKVYVFGHVHMCGATVNTLGFIKIRRDTTDIGLGDASGSRRRINAMSYSEDEYKFVPYVFSCLDAPSSTSSLQYSISIGHWSSSTRAFYLNRSISDSDDYGNPRSISTITAMELAQ